VAGGAASASRLGGGSGRVSSRETDNRGISHVDRSEACRAVGRLRGPRSHAESVGRKVIEQNICSWISAQRQVRLSSLKGLSNLSMENCILSL